ncbi:MAG: dynamin family GTPase [Terrestrivirus sp.]|uniref:Dynamin family GTPase n=1 Tax=Terrestrivirus sp. TaxID=2487775 RepID=A0A3G4ZNR5_9VIRU|nr:MAG: dynamin family GTPase [Terrestrivirus sp.]
MENRINIAIFGPVSAGKSTLTNALFVEQYSDMKIKRTTALPQVYHESLNGTNFSEDILNNNIVRNNDIMKKSENSNYVMTIQDCKEIEYYVPRVFDLIKLRKDILLSFYDLPGLNDAKTKKTYFEYINLNFYKFDIIIFVLDINSAMNTTDEHEILELLINNIKKNDEMYRVQTELIVLLNKCDELKFEDDVPYPSDPEINDMYGQATSIIENCIKKIHPEKFDHYIAPMSVEDAYIYRMYQKNPGIKLDIKYVNKFGANEYGKTRWNKLNDDEKREKIKKLFSEFDYKESIKQAGFEYFKEIIGDILCDEKQYMYLMNHINYRLSCIKNTTEKNFVTHLEEFKKCVDEINKIKKLYPKHEIYSYKISHDNYIEKFVKTYNNSYITKYKNNIPSNSTIDVYQLIKEGYEYMKIFFSDVYEKYCDDGKNITDSLRIYYINECKSFTAEYDAIIKNLYWLKNDNYEQITELIEFMLKNVYSYKCINSQYKSVIDFFNTIESIFKLNQFSMIYYQLQILNYITSTINDKFVLNKIMIKYNVITINNISCYVKEQYEYNKYYTLNCLNKLINNDSTSFTFNPKSQIDQDLMNLFDFVIGNIKKLFPNDITVLHKINNQESTNQKNQSDKTKINTSLIEKEIYQDDIGSLSDEIDEELFGERKKFMKPNKKIDQELSKQKFKKPINGVKVLPTQYD